MRETFLHFPKRDTLKSFYMSDVYPALICGIVLIGNFTNLEVYFNTVIVFLTIGALLICDSIRPFIISLCTSYMQISVKNSPFYPSRSDYLFSGWRFPFLIVMCVMIFMGIFAFVIRNKIYRRISFRNTPFLLSVTVLSLSFVLNGIFSSGFSVSGFLYGLENAVVYSLLLLLMYHGFSSEEDSSELMRYFSYISALIAIVISAELLHLFITSDTVFVDGAINKTALALGWGIWNLIGVSLAVLIPPIFYGMQVGKYPWFYFAVATVAYVMSILTMSRNALIFSTLIYLTCVIISCFKGNYKRVFRIITGVGVVAFILGVMIFWDKISALFFDYIERGFSDNGRFEIWSAAIDNFLSAPVFGNGFYGLKVENFYSFGPVPLMAHNTVLQLLSSMGAFGLIAYGFYAFSVFKPAFIKPTLLKTMLALSMAVLMAQSMLDNFVFNLYPMFYYSAAVAIMLKSDEQSDLQNGMKSIK